MGSWLPLVAAMLMAASAVWTPCDVAGAVVGRPPICVAEELTPQIRKVCDAYDAFSGLAETAQVYLQEIAGPKDMVQLLDAAPKRTDVDHVFLRFGRRR